MLSFNHHHPSGRAPRFRNQQSGRPEVFMTFEDFWLFMGDTGRGASKRTYQRWAREEELETWPDPTDPRGKRRLVSLTEMLKVERKHRQED